MKTINCKNLRTQSKTYKTKRPSWSKKSPGLMTITELSKRKLNKSRSALRVSNKKWTNSMTQLLSIAIRSLNLKIKTSTWNQSLFRNSRKWKDKLLSLRLTLTKSESKRLNWWMKLLNVRGKFFYGKESTNWKVKCKRHLTLTLVNLK